MVEILNPVTKTKYKVISKRKSKKVRNLWSEYKFWGELSQEEKEQIFHAIIAYHPMPCRIYWNTVFLKKFLRENFKVLIRIRGSYFKDKSCYHYFRREFKAWCEANKIPVIFPKKTPASKKAFITPSLAELNNINYNISLSK